MALTTIDGAISGIKFVKDWIKPGPTAVAGHPLSYLYAAGYPAASAAPSPGIGGAVLTTYAGQIPFENPVSGNTYLSRMQGIGSSRGSILLCDRLWHNSGIDLTSTLEQTFTGAAQIPARDATGTNAGVGVYAALEFSAAGGVAAPVYTFKYTNQAATAGQTATTIIATANSPAAGKFHVFALAAGDTGVQLAESITLSTSQISGTAHMVLFRVIARLDVSLLTHPNFQDGLKLGFPRCYDNTVPFIVYISAAAGTVNISGTVAFSQG